MRFSGIYAIRNLADNKKYIGSSNDIYGRLKTHERNLKHNKHKNIELQCDYNDNKDNFVFETIIICEEEMLIKLENFYIKTFNTHNEKYGYNIGSAKRHSHSQLTKDKIRDFMLTYKHSKSHMVRLFEANKIYWENNSRKILQYHGKNNNLIKEWNNIGEIIKNPKYKKGGIYSCLSKNNRRKTAYGFIWRYK